MDFSGRKEANGHGTQAFKFAFPKSKQTSVSLVIKSINTDRHLDKQITIDKIKSIINDAKESDINGFKKILYSMIDEKSKKIFNKLNE